MRISNNMMYKNNLNSILNSQQNVNKAQEQVNTQKRVLTAADDPSATARALLYNDRIQGNEQFTKNITMLNSRLTTDIPPRWPGSAFRQMHQRQMHRSLQSHRRRGCSHNLFRDVKA